MKIRLTVCCALFLIPFFDSAPAVANEFRLRKNGVGPVVISMKVDIIDEVKEFDPFPKKKAEVTVTAQNDSGLPIRYAKFCVQAVWRTKGCDFQVWTRAVWQPGEELTWNVRGPAPKGIERATVVLVKLENEGPAANKSTKLPMPDSKFKSVRKIYVEPVEGNAGAMAREQLMALITNSGRFAAVEDLKLADATIKGHSGSRDTDKVASPSASMVSGSVRELSTAKIESVTAETLVIRLSLPSGDILWAWDDSKPCKQNKPKCAVDDLLRTAAE